MANTIKGLTVEIGGDTTKLGKALENVNKKSKSLSSELGQINKLLKMDPGNADLLAQKQKVLADAVENTKEKLDKLKQAEAQVQEQFKKGEVSEAQVRELQREIIATTKKLDTYERAARETAEAVEKLGDSSGEVTDGAKEVKKGSDKAADSLGDFADAADDAGEASDGLGSKLGGAVKTGLIAVAGLATAAIGALVGAAESTREYRTEMGKLDAAFQASGHEADTAAAAYKELFGVIGETDQAVEAAQQIALLADAEEDVAKWAGLASGVVGTFGDALQPETFFEAANETMKLGEATGAYVQMLEGTGRSVDEFNAGLAACTTEAEKQEYMLRVTEEALGAAGEAYEKANAEIIRANEANEEWTASLAEVGGVIEPILTDVKLLGASLLSDLVPGVKQVAEAFRGILGGDAGAADALGASLSGLLTGLLNKIVEMAPSIAETALSLITSLSMSLLSMAPQILSTGVQLIGTLISGLTSALPQIITQGAQILTSLGQGIAQNLPTLVERALDALMNFATTLYDNAPMLIEAGLDLIVNLVQGIVDALPVLIEKGPEIISKFANIINDNAPKVLAAGVKIIVTLVKGIIQAIPTLIKNIPKIITAFVDVWESFNWLNLGKKAITFLKDGILKMVSAVKSAGSTILTNITNAIKSLPQNLLNLGRNGISSLAQAIRNGVSAVKNGALSILNGIINTIKGLPSRMLSIGADVVRGLWEGISDMTGWVIGKIQSFGENILSGIKSFFGISSPSKLMRDAIGKWIPRGMAVGIEAEADAPIKAMEELNDDLMNEAEELNGLTLERQIKSTFTRPSVTAQQSLNLGDKLDRILEAIERGQILTIDSKTWVGATAERTDTVLGQRRALAARGAL